MNAPTIIAVFSTLLSVVCLCRAWLRKRPKIHLSTALALTFSAGAIIWANTAQRAPGNGMIGWTSRTDVVRFKAAYGWPCRAAWTGTIFIGGNEQPFYFDEFSMLIDFYSALAILFAVWFVCEWWIRQPVQPARKNDATTSV